MDGPWFHQDRTTPSGDEGWIWVFGSNTAGRHGKGAAEVAKLQFGAQYGVGVGRTGDAYAIPTKFEAGNRSLQVLSMDVVRGHIRDFLDYARAHPNLKFFVTRIGCELAKHGDGDVAPLFADPPANCSFANEWREFLTPRARTPRPR